MSDHERPSDSTLNGESLPENWSLVPFGEHCDIQGGTQPPKNVFIYEPMPGYVRLLQIRDFETADHATYIPHEDKLRIVSSDEVLIGRYGASVGKILRGLSGAINVAIVRTIPNESILSKNFLFYLLQGNPFQRFVRNLGGRSAQAGFNKGELSQFLVGIPPLAEQRAIAHVLRTVQQAKEATEKTVAAVQQLKASLMRHLFTYGPVPVEQADKVPLKETEIGPVPEYWSIVPFHRFATLQRGRDLTRQEFKPGSIPVIGATSVMGFHSEANVKGPGVTIVRSGSSVGKPQYIPHDYWAHNVVLYVKDFHGNHPKFVFYRLLELGLTKFKAGVAVPTLNRNTFKDIHVPLPPLQEQHEIADSLDFVQSKIVAEEARRQALESLFKTLLHHLMTGKVRVNELDFSLPKEGQS